MTHEDKVLLYVMAHPDSGYHLTIQGKRDYEQLLTEGFKPTAKEVEAAVLYLKGEQP